MWTLRSTQVRVRTDQEGRHFPQREGHTRVDIHLAGDETASGAIRPSWRPCQNDLTPDVPIEP